jgi:hypothetical protein
MGGGGSGIGHATLERSRFTHRDQRLPSRFWSPLAILPLMRGGGGGGVRNSVVCEVGPLLSGRPPCRISLSPPVLHPNARRGLFPLADSLSSMRFIPIGHPLTPWESIPMGCTLALAGFDGCRIERVDITVARSAKYQRCCVQLEP